jgi:cell division septation protein DedD
MADENLHDIKIDELGSSKKTPLRNILTLLALLFIILVISIVITRLILNTDEGSVLESNDSKAELVNGTLENNHSTATTQETLANTAAVATIANQVKNGAKNRAATTAQAIIPHSNNTLERNLTSAIKKPLTSHEPKVMRTYKEPRKNSTPKKTVVKHTTTKHATTKHTTTTQKHITLHTHPKKEYIDKVVIKKHTTTSKHTKSTTSSKHASYLGGKEKKITKGYYIKVGTYRDTSSVIRKIKKNHFNYALVKVENDKTLTRVLVGPFMSRNQANAQLPKVKANILTGAYVTKVH